MINKKLTEKILSEITADFYKKNIERDQESRLLIPAPTNGIAENLQDLILQKLKLDGNDIPSYLVINDNDKPDKEKKWIRSEGLTTLRQASFCTIVKPDQLSMIKESIVGESGKTVSLSFSDSWPWDRTEEESIFSFETFLEKFADEIELTDEREFFKHFILCLINDTENCEDRHEFLFENVLNKLAQYNAGDNFEEFLYHSAGLPNIKRDENKDFNPRGRITRFCRDLEMKFSAVSRNEALNNAANGGIHPNKDHEINEMYNLKRVSLDSKYGLVSMSKTFKKLDKKYWMSLDEDALEIIFDMKKKADSDNSISARFVDKDLRCYDLPNPDLLILKRDDNNELVIRVKWNIVIANADPTNYKIRAKILKKDIHDPVQLDDKKGEVDLNIPLNELPNRDSKNKIRQKPHEITILLEDENAELNNQKKKVKVVILDNDIPIITSVGDKGEIIFPPMEESNRKEIECKKATIRCFANSYENITIKIDGEERENLFVRDKKEEWLWEIKDPINPITLNPIDQRIDLDIELSEVKNLMTLKSSIVPEKDSIEKKYIQEIRRSGKDYTQLYNLFESGEKCNSDLIDEGFLEKYVTLFEKPNQDGKPIMVEFDRLSYEGGHNSKFDIDKPSSSIFHFESNFKKKLDLNFPEISSDMQNQNYGKIQHYVDEYVLARKNLTDYLTSIFKSNYQASITLASYCPLYIREKEDDISSLIQKYLNAYNELIKFLRDQDEINIWIQLSVAYMDCIVFASIDKSDSSRPKLLTDISALIGPWHPLMVLYRFERQKMIHMCAKYINSENLNKYSVDRQYLEIIYDYCCFRSQLMFDINNSEFQHGFVFNTSDPNWCYVENIKTGEEEKKNKERHRERLRQYLKLKIRMLPEGSASLTESFLNKYLDAFPTERRLEIYVRKGIEPENVTPFEISSPLKNYFYEDDKPTKRARMLVGGIHIYFSERGIASHGNQYIEPATYIYEDKKEIETLKERNIDILLTPHRNEITWSNTKVESSLPRGKEESGSLSTHLTWLKSTSDSPHTVNYMFEKNQDHEIKNELIEYSFGIENIVADLSSLGKKRVMQWKAYDGYTSDVKWIIVPTHSNEDPSHIINQCRPNNGPSRLLWEYKIDFSGRNAEYFILSEISSEFKNILPEQIRQNDEDIVRDLSLVGVAVGGESFKTKSSSKGVLGTIYAAWLLKQFEKDRVFSHGKNKFPIRDNDKNLVGMLLPVDNFDFLMSHGEEMQMCDFLAIQVEYRNEEKLLISASAVECKYRTSKYSSIDRAINQCMSTHKRFLDLFGDGLGSASIIQRLVLLKIIQFGLQLSHKGATNRKSVVENRDSKILAKILKGEYEYKKPKYDHLVISTEDVNEEDNLRQQQDPNGMWIRIPHDPRCIPSNSDDREEDVIIKKHREMLADLFFNQGSDDTMIGNLHPNDYESQLEEEQDEHSEKGEEQDEHSEKGDELDEDESADSSHHIDNSGIKYPIGLGLKPNRGERYEFNPGDTSLSHLNIGIVGDMGKGKTQLTQALLLKQYQSSKMNRSKAPKFLILDYKNSFYKQNNTKFADATASRIVKYTNIPLNLFAMDPKKSKEENQQQAMTSQGYFFDILNKIYSGFGPNQRANFRDSVLELYSEKMDRGRDAPLIYDIAERYKDKITNNDALSNILDEIVLFGIFEKDHSKIISFEQFFDKNIIVSLGDIHSDQLKKTIVMMFLRFFYTYMYSRDTLEFIDGKRFVDSMLVIDEAHNIMRYNFPDLEKVLVEGREFGVGVLLASQYMSQFRASQYDYREPLGTWFVQGVSMIKERDLEDIGITGENSELKKMTNRIKKLEKFECLYKTAGVTGDFIKVEPFYKILENEKKKLIDDE
ncbi:MAG: hypothetical protein ACJ0HZ_06555 [Woeseiaceae bacterium]